jgi:putative transposase
MAYGVYLYYCSRSLRLASRSLEPIVERSHVSIWHWVQRLAPLAGTLRVDRRSVKQVFVDETLIRFKGREYWLWIAYEPRLDRCLVMHLSVERTLMVCYLFLKRVRATYGVRPIATDGGTWYPEACRWLRLEHRVYPTPEKNLIERFIQRVKDRDRVLRRLLPVQEGRVRQGARVELAQPPRAPPPLGHGPAQDRALPGEEGRLS